MRRSYLLATMLVVVATRMVTAQTIIPKIGLTLAKIAYQDDEGASYKLGFTAGVGYNLTLDERYSIQPELLFVQKGLKEKLSDGPLQDVIYSWKTKATINYIELPVLVKASFGRAASKFYANTGPSIGVGLGGKLKWENSLADHGTTYTQRGTSKIKFGKEPDDNEGDRYLDHRVEFGWQLGGGILIAEKVILDLRYGLGLTNLKDAPYGAFPKSNYKSKNRVFQFTVGIPIKSNLIKY